MEIEKRDRTRNFWLEYFEHVFFPIGSQSRILPHFVPPCRTLPHLPPPPCPQNHSNPPVASWKQVEKGKDDHWSCQQLQRGSGSMARRLPVPTLPSNPSRLQCRSRPKRRCHPRQCRRRAVATSAFIPVLTVQRRRMMTIAKRTLIQTALLLANPSSHPNRVRLFVITSEHPAQPATRLE